MVNILGIEVQGKSEFAKLCTGDAEKERSEVFRVMVCAKC